MRVAFNDGFSDGQLSSTSTAGYLQRWVLFERVVEQPSLALALLGRS